MFFRNGQQVIQLAVLQLLTTLGEYPFCRISVLRIKTSLPTATVDCLLSRTYYRRRPPPPPRRLLPSNSMASPLPNP